MHSRHRYSEVKYCEMEIYNFLRIDRRESYNFKLKSIFYILTEYHYRSNVLYNTIYNIDIFFNLDIFQSLLISQAQERSVNALIAQ